jgi:hypothetical protein
VTGALVINEHISNSFIERCNNHQN